MESLDTSPTEFTLKFLAMDFKEFAYLLDGLNDGVTPSQSDLPAVCIPGLDKDILTKIASMCRHDLEDRFLPVPTQKLFTDWCYSVRSNGWASVIIKQQAWDIKSHGGQVTNVPYEINGNSELENLCKDLFGNWWSHLHTVKVMKVEPGGWLHPHRDLAVTDYKLCNFWIPLHEFSAGLKVFPMGWLRHSLGNMYLFNRTRYPHALINKDTRSRFAMIGKFHLEAVPQDLVNKFLKNKSTFMDIWN